MRTSMLLLTLILAPGCMAPKSTSPVTEDGGSAADAGVGCGGSTRVTAGFDPDLSIQRYRLIAASADGSKVALLLSHFGPSSRDPFVSVMGFSVEQVGATFSVARADIGAGEDELALTQLERETLQDAEVVQAFANQHLVPFPDGGAPSEGCGAASIVDGGWAFRSNPRTCDLGVEADWTMCTGTRCARGTFACFSPVAPTGLVAAYRVNDVTWFVAQQTVEALQPLVLTLRTAAGTR